MKPSLLLGCAIQVCFPALIAGQASCLSRNSCVVPVMMIDSTLPTGTIKGLVIAWNPRDTGTAAIVSYAGIEVVDQATKREVRTTTGGTFEFSGVRPGRDTLNAAFIGYGGTGMAIEVPARGGLRVLMVLQAGHVVLSDDRFDVEESPHDTSDRSWMFADSDLVANPSWISGTVIKNIVTVGFKKGTSEARRNALIASVRGEIVELDSMTGWVTLRVPTHPDACGVKQAVDLLKKAPEVTMAIPELVLTPDEHASIDPGSGLVQEPATHHGSLHPCPPGVSLLR